MSTIRSLFRRCRQRWEIRFIKAALCLVHPVEVFLDRCSAWLGDTATETAYLELGKAVHRCYAEHRTALQMQRLMTAYQLHLSREELVAKARENRQLRGRLQMYEYEEDAARVNRDTLLDLHKEKYDLNERNGQLKSELSRTEFLLESIEQDIDEWRPRPRPRRDEQRISGVFNNECACSFESEEEPCGSFSETGTVKVYSSVSAESLESESGWVSRHQIIVHVSSNISPKPD